MAELGRTGRVLFAGIALSSLAAASPEATRAMELSFGPVTCQRGVGAATRCEYAFKSPQPSRGFVLKVYNGGLEDTTYELVSSSAVTLNGSQVLGPSAFNQNVAYAEVPVALREDNTLAVEVRGKPGGAMILKVQPVVVIDVPHVGQWFPTQPTVVSGHLNAVASAVAVNGVSAVIGGRSFKASGVPLSEGNNALTATAEWGGLIIGSDRVDVVLDSAPPVLVIDYPEEGLVTKQNVTPRYTVHDALDANPTVTVTPAPPYASEGTYLMTLTATDRTGNAATASRTFIIDKTPPTISVASPIDGFVAKQDVVLAYAVEDSQDPSPTVTVAPAPPYGAEGAYHVTITATDQAGNQSQATRDFIIDTTAPAISAVSPLEGATVTVAAIDVMGSVDDPAASVTVNGVAVPLAGTVFAAPGFALAIGMNEIRIEAQDAAGNAASLVLHVTYAPPTPTAGLQASPATILRGKSATLSWTAVNATFVTIDQGIGSVPTQGSLEVTPLVTTTYTITATGPGGSSAAAATLSVTAAGVQAHLTATPNRIPAGASSLLAWDTTDATTVVIEPGIGAVAAAGTVEVAPAVTTIYTLLAIGPSGNARSEAAVTVLGAVSPQPAGSFGARYEDLIPEDAVIPAYDPARFSIVTGLVRRNEHEPVGGVAVSVQGHPEYGTAWTDAEGRFFLPVEGGGTLTVGYRKAGLLEAHRHVIVPWNDFVLAETVSLTAPDPLATQIVFDGDPASAFTHQGTGITDTAGTRAATLVFAGDTQAYAVTESGDRLLPSITVRATEYATEKSMPGLLPATSAYTYCAEFGIDGVAKVRFSRPVSIYIENFLGFPVGSAVPYGSYDRERGTWIPQVDGVVVRLLDVNGDGAVDALDATGNGIADDLDGDGSVFDEAGGLGDGSRYAAGTTYWRIRTTHFSPGDPNWPWLPFPGGGPPDPPGPPADGGGGFGLGGAEGAACDASAITTTNSVVDNRTGTYFDDVPLPGTGLALRYSSERTGSRKRVFHIPINRSSLPQGLQSMEVRATVAGREYSLTLPPEPNKIVSVAWDGLDALGRPASGSQRVRISVGYTFPLLQPYVAWSLAQSLGLDPARTFGQPPRAITTTVVGRMRQTYWRESELLIHSPLTAEGDGEWSFDAVHRMDPKNPSLIFTGGGGWKGSNLTPTIHPLAGTGAWGLSGDGGPARQATMYFPKGIAVGPDGTIYFSDTYNHRIRKIAPDGIVSTVAGSSWYFWDSMNQTYYVQGSGYSGDGGPAWAAALNFPEGLALDGAGNLFVADRFNHVIRKIDRSGVITTVAGSPGQGGFSGDGGPATAARLAAPVDVAADSSGALYIADYDNLRVRKVGPDGRISTVAGISWSGSYGSPFSGDGGLATNAAFHNPTAVEADDAGNIFVANGGFAIRKIAPNGIVSLFAGTPAGSVEINGVHDIAIDRVGKVYLANSLNQNVLIYSQDGSLFGVVGDATVPYAGGFSGDGGPTTEALLSRPMAVGVDASGAIFIADTFNERIRKVTPAGAFQRYAALAHYFYPDNNGRGYVFDSGGRHLETIDLDSGTTVMAFDYDGDGRLVSIRDRFGARTAVERDSSGRLAAVTAPYGQRTTFHHTAAGQLSRVVFPDGSEREFTYDSQGRMVAKKDARGNLYEHAFDDTGRLTDSWDPEGGHWRFAQWMDSTAGIWSSVTTAEGDVTRHRDFRDQNGASISRTIPPTGGEATTATAADGLSVTTVRSCGTSSTENYDLDPLYGYRFLKSSTLRMPSGLTLSGAYGRTRTDTDGDTIPDLISDSRSINGKTWSAVNNVLAGVVASTSPAGRVSWLSYGPGTLLPLEAAVPGFFPVTYAYDSAGRLVGTAAGDRSTAVAYDANGNLDAIVDADGRIHDYSYDIMGRLASVVRPDGSVVRYEYDANGNLAALTNPNGASFIFDHTANNQRAAMSTPILGEYQYLYNRDRRLADVLLPSGRTVRNVYADGVLDSTETPEGRTDYDYLCGGRLSSAARGGEGVALSYDGPLVMVDTRSGTLAGVVSYTYTNDFAVSSVAYAGAAVNLSYDADGLLTQSGSYAISRDARHGLPLAVSGNGMTLARTFSGHGEMDAQSWTVAGGAAYDWAVTRDLAGRVLSRSETVAGTVVSWSYRYDSAGRLLQVQRNGLLVEEYAYDPNGNRLAEMNTLRDIAGRSYSHSVEDHALAAGSDSFVFDVDGFLRSSVTARGTTTFEYSTRGELLRADLPDGTIVTYVHDPFGRRIAKYVNGAAVAKYLWADRTTLLALYDGGGNLVQRYSYADGRVPVSLTASGATYFLLTDQVGTLRAVADTSGNIVKRIDYDSFGNIIADTNPAFAVPFGFAGGLHDRDTGLVRFGYRDYSPELGRFTAKDPIDFAGGSINLYAYAMSDPVNFVDPLGLWNWDVHSGSDRSDYGTFTWARQLGISKAIATSIALADNGADAYGNWAPIVGNPGRHFDTAAGGVDSRMLFASLDLALAVRQHKAGNSCQAYETLGRGLHGVQDIPAHMGWTPLVPHPAWYDDVSRRPDALKATEIATKAYLLQFLQAIGQ